MIAFVRSDQVVTTGIEFKLLPRNHETADVTDAEDEQKYLRIKKQTWIAKDFVGHPGEQPTGE